MRKKGQFYLIAAIIIVVVLLGLSSLTNYIVEKKEPARFYDLSEEINEESYRVSEYSIINQDKNSEFIEDFVSYAGEELDNFAVLYGDVNSANITYYKKQDTGEITLTSGGNILTTITGTRELSPEGTAIIENPGDQISVDLLDKTYNFQLKDGENFIFIITKQEEENVYIKKTEEPGTGNAIQNVE